ncbi:alpha/beta hydrolase family esterase [Oceanicella actignis]|uniref:Polyhydroxybutyrate depolymerase n=1 Tax=Oceanicella actignis TaxID=1189325 RepID=A0A1M7SC08_9RHOB|nr:PHB depolymerase family esterase [Oceanicella actignis]TYO91488.1 polyhydroxybutyrate depolymerase [Oceanicella actignis]SET26508.1 polyhydroxybutyrate depolymerase [Oceanicella actignis]SHN56057.1 polyhydroxybutyrate depolymerase [Oceanicella actignis]
MSAPARLLRRLCAALAAAALGLAASPVGARADAAPEIRLEKRAVGQGAAARRWWLERARPAEGAPPAPAPVLVALHDAGGSASDLRRTARFSLARRGWLVVYPEAAGPERAWNVGRKTAAGLARKGADDVGFIAAIVAALRDEGLADPSRLFLAGMGEGGLMALRLTCAPGPVWRGAAAVMGGWPPDLVCDQGRPTPVLLFNASLDPVQPLHGGRAPPGLRAGSGAAASVARTAANIGARNGCAGFETRFLPAPPPLRVELRAHRCATPFEQVIIHGAGRRWPGAPEPADARARGLGPPAPVPDATAMIEAMFLSLANQGRP